MLAMHNSLTQSLTQLTDAVAVSNFKCVSLQEYIYVLPFYAKSTMAVVTSVKYIYVLPFYAKSTMAIVTSVKNFSLLQI